MIEGTFDLCHPDASISRTFIWFMNALKNAFVIETEIYQNKLENWDKQKVRDYLIQTILRVDRIVLTFRMIKFLEIEASGWHRSNVPSIINSNRKFNSKI
jgi:hypothetical protein